MWSDGSEFWNDDLKSIKDKFGLFLSSEEIFAVLSSLGSGSSFLFIKHNESFLTSVNIFDQLSLSGSERFDSLSGLLDFISGMRDSGIVVSNLIFAFSHFGRVSIVSRLLLSFKVIHHVSDEVSNILHWGVG